MAANAGNAFQIGDLNLTENTLTVVGGNEYRLRVAGTTTIQGTFANVNMANNYIFMELAGKVTGSGALNRVSTIGQSDWPTFS